MVEADDGPLSGLTVGRLEAGVGPEVAAWLLAGMGATVLEARPPVSPFVAGPARPASASECAQADLLLESRANSGGRPGARLAPSPVPCPVDGVPTGTLSYATGVALAVAALAAWRSRLPIEVAELGVAIQIYLPDVMAFSYGSPTWAQPPVPVAAAGGGWLSADLGAEGDREQFEHLKASLPPDADAATISAAAQEWRLAVCEYRPRIRGEAAAPPYPVRRTAVAGTRDLARRPGQGPAEQPVLPPLADITVCDLTAMWAGPLTTWLLQELGATVHKVEAPIRLDGTRAIDGGGIYPQGRQRRPGQDSAIWNALNRGKNVAPLDLRHPAPRRQFVALARSCDVMIDSFSPRVMPNFGLNEQITRQPGAPLLASIPAFPTGPQRDWVAYGTGIHALTGLGDRGDATFAAPGVTYPDPICGFTAAFGLLAALVGRDRGRAVERLEVALLSATRPLLAFDDTRDPGKGLGVPPLDAGKVLFEAGVGAGAFAAWPVAGLQLLHPKGPFSVLRPGSDGDLKHSEDGAVSG